MARYSFATYGTSGLKYGQLENNRAYYNASLVARSLTYQYVYLYWSSVLTDPGKEITPGVAATVTHWKLVRNYSGASDDPYDGTTVDSGTIGNYRTTAIDGPLEPNTQVTYSLWIFDGVDWINCGNASAVVVSESLTPTLLKVEKWLPAAWLNVSGDEVGEPEDNPLTQVLSGYSYAYDKLRAEANLLSSSMDYRYTPIQLLRNKIEERGFSYEPVLGDVYHRSVYRVSEKTNATKGTKQAIASYVTALTHWVPEIKMGKNLMFDYNDSSFEESVGKWVTIGDTPAGTTITQHLYANSATQFGSAIPLPPVLYTNPNTAFAPRDKGFGVVNLPNSNANGGAISIGSATADKTLYGIPVTEGKTYKFGGFFRMSGTSSVANNIQVFLAIIYYDKNGNSVGTPTPSAVAVLTPGNWLQIFDTELVPATAVRAIPRIFYTPGSNTGTNLKLYMDMLYFQEYKDSDFYFEDARKTLIYVAGDKTNLIHNPSFEISTNWWTAHNGTLTRVTTPSYAIHRGTRAAKFEATGTLETAGIVSDWMPVLPGQVYTFSAYVSAPPTKSITARIEFSALQSAEDQAQILTDSDGDYYPVNEYYVDDIEIISDSKTRITVSAVAPSYVIDAGLPSAKVSLFLSAAEAGDVFYVDGVQLERGGTATTYFDGEGANLPSNPLAEEVIKSAECRWEYGAVLPGYGRSYRWTNYAAKLARLYDTLPLVMPYASSWEIISGLPTPEFPELSPSILTSPSFEQSTAGWITNSSSLSRQVYRGTIFDEYSTNGVAFGKVTSTAATAFGITSDKGAINSLAGYYTSVAVKPENADAFGNYTLTARFYDSAGILMISKTKTVRVQVLNRWAYIAVFAPKAELLGATSADVKIECTPDSPAIGIVFDVDRVVFRQ